MDSFLKLGMHDNIIKSFVSADKILKNEKSPSVQQEHFYIIFSFLVPSNYAHFALYISFCHWDSLVRLQV